MRQPDFFIVGAPKCGTTAMNEYLMQHPEIFMPGRKELHFFGSDLHFKTPRLTEQKYLSYFSRAKGEKRLGESSVLYLYSEKAASEIKAFCPHANIIIMLRNPIDMIYSWHSHLLYWNEENIEQFDVALDKEEGRKRGLHIPINMTTPIECLFYREIAKYTQQIKRYLEIFGQEKVHIILFDDFTKNTPEVYRKTLRFLDVTQESSLDFRVFNPNKRWRSKFFGHLLVIAPAFAQKLGMSALPDPVRHALVYLHSLPKRLNTRHEPRLPMNPHIRCRLQREFTPEIDYLSELLRRDLSHWIRE
jgi:hypothetical protein